MTVYTADHTDPILGQLPQESREEVALAKQAKLEAAIWDYIRDRMISPSDCTLIYLHPNPWPGSIVAEGYPAERLDL